MKFDVVIMNPPYQGQIINSKEARNNLLWPDFVNKSLEICKQNGFICNIHPSLWRKPEHNLFKKLSSNNMLYLNMNSNKTGKRIFGVDTHFDWYIIKKAEHIGKTTVVDEDGLKYNLDITTMPFIPGSNIDFIMKLAGSPFLDILYSTSYHNQSTGVSKTKSEKFCYPVVHSITHDTNRILYSNSNKKGVFGVKNKVIVSTSRNLYTLLDLNGTFGTTEGCFSIVATDEHEATQIEKALMSREFQDKVVKNTKWSNFRIDYKMFKYFRKNFWHEFV